LLGDEEGEKQEGQVVYPAWASGHDLLERGPWLCGSHRLVNRASVFRGHRVRTPRRRPVRIRVIMPAIIDQAG
jgi:hypothetical protein